MFMDILFNESIKKLSSSEIYTYLMVMFKQAQFNYPLTQKELVPEQSATTTSKHLRKAASVGLIDYIKTPKVIVEGRWVAFPNSYKPIAPTYRIRVEEETDLLNAALKICWWAMNPRYISDEIIVKL